MLMQILCFVLCHGTDSFTFLGELFCGVDEGTREHVGTKNVYVLCPGVDGLAVLRKLSSGNDVGIHFPLPNWDLSG